VIACHLRAIGGYLDLFEKVCHMGITKCRIEIETGQRLAGFRTVVFSSVSIKD
jgi:hypothetical protein